MPEGAYRVHGLSAEFLKKHGKPFEAVIDDFMEFIADDILIAHNARFDMGFINAELKRAGREPIPNNRFKDTLAMAHAKFPGSPASLDALCKRFEISLSARDKHGAIIDSELLAAVYLELSGGRERRLGLGGAEKPQMAKSRPAPLAELMTDSEAAAHKKFIEGMGDKAVWQKVWRQQARG
jgi:DNA polymerase-3 subunit epsilon